ncbi:MAG: phosphopantetheine-binding protein [Pusillimonas sp.]
MSNTLTLESMRTDIARILNEDPADIADDDNLMDLGLDSMRTMTLASQWRDAGVAIEFSEMALDATLGHWWSLVQASRQG